MKLVTAGVTVSNTSIASSGEKHVRNKRLEDEQKLIELLSPLTLIPIQRSRGQSVHVTTGSKRL